MKHLIHRSSIFSRLLPAHPFPWLFSGSGVSFEFWQGGCAPANINQNAVDLLSEQTYDHQQYLENEMTQRWSDLGAKRTYCAGNVSCTVMQQYDVRTKGPR